MLPCPDPLKNALKCYCEFPQSFSGLRFARCPWTHNFNQMGFFFSIVRWCSAIRSSSHVLPPHQDRIIWQAAPKTTSWSDKKSALVCETHRERTGSSWQQHDPQNRADGQDGSEFDSPSKPCHIQVSLRFVLFNLLACPTPQTIWNSSLGSPTEGPL